MTRGLAAGPVIGGGSICAPTLWAWTGGDGPRIEPGDRTSAEEAPPGDQVGYQDSMRDQVPPVTPGGATSVRGRAVGSVQGTINIGKYPNPLKQDSCG